jgi:protein O-mannosyl-transferase
MKKTNKASSVIRPLWVWLGFVLLGILIYSNTFHSTFHFDDEIYITENYSLRNIGNIKGIWDFFPTRFIAFLSFALNYFFHKFDVFGYHLVNLAIHLAASILVWRLVRLIFLTPAMERTKLTQHADTIALFTGLIFLAHPIQTQAVTYIFQRCCSLVAFFYLLSLCLYLKGRLAPAAKGRFYYLCSWASGLTAMFTKETAATLPLMIILMEFIFFGRGGLLKWKKFIPFLALLAVIPLAVFSKRTDSLNDMERLLNQPGTGWHYFLTQLRVCVTYLRLLLIPLNQNLDYDYPWTTSFFNLPTIGSLLLLTALLVFAVRLFRRQYKLLSFGIFWFFLILAPESSIVPLKDVIFEHRLYLPMVGFGLFAVAGLITLFQERALRPLKIFLILWIGCYSVMTYQRNKVWKDETTLWNDIMRKAPSKVRSYNNRGIDQMNRGDLDQAIEDYNKAIEIHPDSPLGYNNRGDAYLNQGDFEQAISDYTRAMELDPRFVEAYYNRGTAYLKLGEFPQALADFDMAIRVNPDYSRAYYNRGTIYLKQGDAEAAIQDFSRAIQIDPDYAQAYNNRGNLFLKQGDFEGAMSDFNRALKANPGIPEIYNNRGNIYMARGQLNEAVKDFNKALELNPNYASVYCNRGMAFEEAGDHGRAIADYDRAIELNPGFAQAYYIRAIAFFKMGKHDQSWKDAQKAEALGFNVDPHFMKQLKATSVRGR